MFTVLHECQTETILIKSRGKTFDPDKKEGNCLK